MTSVEELRRRNSELEEEPEEAGVGEGGETWALRPERGLDRGLPAQTSGVLGTHPSHSTSMQIGGGGDI